MHHIAFLLITFFRRCFHVCWPLVAHRTQTLRLSQILTAATLVASLAVCGLAQYNATYRPIAEPHHHQAHSRQMALVIASYSNIGIYLVIALNSAVVVQLIRTRKTQSVLRASNTNPSTRGTYMIVGMTAMFLTLKVPYVVAVVFWMVNGSSGGADWVGVGILVNLVNSSINFFVYFAVCPYFRSHLAELVAWKWCESPIESA